MNQQRNEIRVIIENDRGFKWYGVTFSPWGLQEVMRELTKEYMRRVVLESKGARDPWGRGGDAKPEEPTDVGEQVEVLGELEDIHARLVKLSTRLSDAGEDVQSMADYLTRFNP